MFLLTQHGVGMTARGELVLPPEHLRSHLSTDAMDFLLQALAVNPDRRPSAATLLQHRWLHPAGATGSPCGAAAAVAPPSGAPSDSENDGSASGLGTAAVTSSPKTDCRSACEDMLWHRCHAVHPGIASVAGPPGCSPCGDRTDA
jgi:serine/threonine protein kinase